MKLIQHILRYVLVLFGLAGVGIIVFEVLRKWQFMGKATNPLWIVAPIFILFFCKEIFSASYLVNKQIISKHHSEISFKLINALLVIIAILILISIPFIWYGTIEELAGRAGGGVRPSPIAE
jgi:hypothetical protein